MGLDGEKDAVRGSAIEGSEQMARRLSLLRRAGRRGREQQYGHGRIAQYLLDDAVDEQLVYPAVPDIDQGQQVRRKRFHALQNAGKRRCGLIPRRAG